MSQVKVTARTNSAYCDRRGMWPQRISPSAVAPRSRKTSSVITTTMVVSTASTW